MSVKLTIQQKQAIAEYRQQHNLNASVSDSQVVAQMIKSGQIPACFASLAAGRTSSSANNQTIFNGKTGTQTFNQQNKTEQNQLNKELASLGLTNRNGAGEKITIGNNEYTVVGEANNGRKIVQDSKGQLQIFSHDNKLLNKDYVIQKNATDAIKNNPKVAQNTALRLIEAHVNNAETAFENQLAEDGWAGDFADGISVLWGSDNRASKVSKDIEKYKKDLANLQKAVEQGDKNFNAKFKSMFGVEFNQQAIADYVQNPTDENYQKAFGTKNNINKRVNDYNKSQQTGATVVKGSATVAAGVAIGVATAGTGIAAVGMAAAGTAASSAAINVSDRLTSDVGLKDGELQDILKSAAWDGASVVAGGAVGKIASTAIKGGTTAAKAGRVAANTAGDVGMGAAQEYAETGKVSTEGVLINAAMSGVGGAAGEGVLKDVGQKIKNSISSDGGNPTPQIPNTPQTVVTTSGNTRKSNTPMTISKVPDNTPQTDNPTKTTTATTVEAQQTTATPPAAGTSSAAPKKVVDTHTPAIDNYLAKNGQVSKEERRAFEAEEDAIIGKAYSNTLENPKETLKKLEQVYIQTNNKSSLKMLNLVKKRLEKLGVKVNDSYASMHHASNSRIESILHSTDDIDDDLAKKFMDIDQTLSLVEDQKVKDLIDEQLDIYIKNNGNVDEDFLLHLQETIDTVNAYNGHYSVYKAEEDYGNLSAMARFSKLEIPFNGGYIMGKDILSGKKLDKFADETQDALTRDIATENRLYPMRQYFKDNVSTDKSFFNSDASAELSNHLYDNYYLKELERQNIDPSIINQCKELNEKLGVKVMIPADENYAKQILSTIEEDLSKWQKASNGQAKMPPVIDFSSVKAEWFERGAAGGYSEADFNGSLAFSPISKKNQSEEFREILRHEMAHTNDLKFNDETIKFDEVLQSCNYAEELKNAGLSDFYINYAGTDKREFIAVAAQGDMSKYSAEFKETLINLGMPEWLFNV